MKNRIALVVISFSMFLSCGNDNILTPEERVIIDSLYSISISKEKIKLDSICAMEKDTTFKHAVDSIKKIRIAEIEQLINK